MFIDSKLPLTSTIYGRTRLAIPESMLIGSSKTGSLMKTGATLKSVGWTNTHSIPRESGSYDTSHSSHVPFSRIISVNWLHESCSQIKPVESGWK